MWPFKILLATSAFILSDPFPAIPFPNHFHLFLYTFPLSIFSIEIIRDSYPFCPQHIQHAHDPNMVMRPIIRIVRVCSHRISLSFTFSGISSHFSVGFIPQNSKHKYLSNNSPPSAAVCAALTFHIPFLHHEMTARFPS